MKISRKMWLMIILEVAKNQVFTLPLVDTFFEKPQWGVKLTPPAVLGLITTDSREKQYVKIP